MESTSIKTGKLLSFPSGTMYLTSMVDIQHAKIISEKQYAQKLLNVLKVGICLL